MVEKAYTVHCPWSKMVWLITSLFFILFIFIIGVMIHAIIAGGVIGGIIGLIIALPILLTILIYCEGHSLQRIEISPSQIVLLRRYNSIIIPRSHIISITPLSKRDMRGTINEGGNAGLFGYAGSFRNRRIGKFNMYATAASNLFLICTTEGKKIVINCCEPEQLNS